MVVIYLLINLASLVGNDDQNDKPITIGLLAMRGTKNELKHGISVGPEAMNHDLTTIV